MWGGVDLVVVEHKGRVPVGRPLGEDEDAEVAEDGVDEDLREKHTFNQQAAAPNPPPASALVRWGDT